MSKVQVQHENEESVTDDEATLHLSNQHQFIVSSVALSSELQSSNEINDKNDNTAHEGEIFPNIDMEEIPSGRVYCLDIKNGLLLYKNIAPKNKPNNSTSITSAACVSETEPITTEINSMSVEQASEKLHKYLNQAIR